MGKHSFAPKLSRQEYEELSTFSGEWSPAVTWYTEQLACRGLLERNGNVTHGEIDHVKDDDNLSDGKKELIIQDVYRRRCHQFDYRLSKRGELMRQRYQYADSDRRQREAAREWEAAA